MQSREKNSLNGKIKSVYCENFVTYKKCSFYPTEYLNIIIGPNGTGKSTLVAAIVLGLGGDPKLLSRAVSIKDYIRNGCTKAMIKIEIFSNEEGKFVSFERSFGENGKSEYKVNGGINSKSDFLAAVAVYKVDISNLCQFLPQDRVQDFAKMTPQTVFENTISSVCQRKTLEDFSKLKGLKSSHLEKETNQKSNVKKLMEYTARLDELKQLLNNYKVHKEYQDRLEVCAAKKLWVEVDEMELKLQEQKNDIICAENVLKARQEAFNTVQKKSLIVKQNTKKMTDDVAKEDIKQNEYRQQTANLSTEIDSITHKIEESEAKFKEKTRDLNSRLKNELQMKAILEKDLSDFNAELGTDFDPVGQIQQLDEKSTQIKIEHVRYNKEHSEINLLLNQNVNPKIQKLDKEIESATNIENLKLQRFKIKYPKEFEASEWIRENERMFKGKVYMPVMLELNVRDAKHGMYFENTIPNRDMRAFGCEEKSDMTILSDELIKRNLNINLIHVGSSEECNYSPPESIDRLKKYGFTFYLINLIDGPPAILNYLCGLYNLHKIPIGTDEVNKHTDDIPQNITHYFGGDQRYVVSISKYSKQPSTMKSMVKSKELLSTHINTAEIQKLKERRTKLTMERDAYRNKRSKIEAQIDDIKFKNNELRAKKQSMEAKLRNLQHLKEKTEQQKQKIDNIQKSIEAIPEMKKSSLNLVANFLQRLVELQSQKVETLKSYEKSVAFKKLLAMKSNIYEQQNQQLINALDETNQNKIEAQKNIDNIQHEIEKTKSKVKHKLGQAKLFNRTDTKSPLMTIYNALPNDLLELNDQINTCKAHLECMNEIDPQIIAEHDVKTREVETLKSSINENAVEETNITTEIKSIFNEWYPEINGVIETLNTTFSSFMQAMGYVGEILLIRKEELDFESYGIDIRVQYRKNVAMETLDRNVQSGGERAVAIAVYTLSLQHITHVPFCCVDEINQGMDARNERKIFDLLIGETTKTGRAQYFFVTPKLLPHLKFNERVSVHVVFNGKFVQPENAFLFEV